MACSLTSVLVWAGRKTVIWLNNWELDEFILFRMHHVCAFPEDVFGEISASLQLMSQDSSTLQLIMVSRAALSSWADTCWPGVWLSFKLFHYQNVRNAAHSHCGVQNSMLFCENMKIQYTKNFFQWLLSVNEEEVNDDWSIRSKCWQLIFRAIQSNLRTKDALGTGLLSFVRRLSLSWRFNCIILK